VRRVLLLTNDFPPIPGGCSRYYLRLCQQAPPGTLTVLAPRQPGAQDADARVPARVVRRWLPVSPQPLARAAQCLLFAVHAALLLIREPTAAVHLGHLYLAPVGAVLHRLFGIPYVLYLHGGEMPSLLRRRRVRAAYARWLRGAKCVVVNSDFTRRHFEALGMSHPRTVVLPPTIDPRPFLQAPGGDAVRDLLGWRGRRVILSVGRLVRRKGHDLLLRAVAGLVRDLPDVALLIVGEGPERSRLEALAGALGIRDRTHFAGFVPEAELPLYYRAADVFAMPSQALPERDGVEGFGIVFLEAGASGVPVVGTRTGGIEDAVLDGRTGYLVPSGDVDRLREALRTLLEDRDTARRFGEEGRRRACRDQGRQVEALWRISGVEVSGPGDAAGRIRILHVITRLVVGGAQENTLLTVAGLDPRRYHVELAAGPEAGPEGSLSPPPGVPFHLVPTLVRDVQPWRDLRALLDLYRLMRRGRYDVVHTHTSKAGLLGRLAARLAGVPVVVHTPHGHVFSGYGPRALIRIFVWAERCLARWTHSLVALTPTERDDHLREGVGEPAQWTVIPSGIPLDRFTGPGALRRTDLGLPEGEPVVGCVARLVPVKGVGDLLEALAQVRASGIRAHCALVGDGPLREHLRVQARALGVDDVVHFVGLRRDVPQVLPLFDVVALPSRNEGMGRALLEAQAAGIPVVASRVGGIPDVVEDGRTGVLVPPGDPRALAEALVTLLANPGLRAAMGRAAREAVGRDLGVAAMVERLDALYTSLRGSGREERGLLRPSARRGGSPGRAEADARSGRRVGPVGLPDRRGRAGTSVRE
jgi:glycosyltransferase involved in cell wall biosynthesis